MALMLATLPWLLADTAVADISPTAESLALAIAFGLAACGLGDGLSGAVGLPSINLAVIAVMALLFATLPLLLADTAVADISPTAESLALAIAFGLAACGLGEGLSGAVGLPSINLAVMAVMASVFASAGSSFCTRMGSKVTTPFRGNERIWLSWLQLPITIPAKHYQSPASLCCLTTVAFCTSQVCLVSSAARRAGTDLHDI